jgi:hypothetical protein
MTFMWPLALLGLLFLPVLGGLYVPNEGALFSLPLPGASR